MTEYTKGEADKTHLNSIFGTRDDSPTPPERTNALSSYSTKAALLSANKIPAVMARAGEDNNGDGDFEDADDVRAVEAVLGDIREAALYWYEEGENPGENDSKVDLAYSGAPSFNPADYDPDAAIKSPYGPNLNIPEIDNDTVGAFTAPADNPVLVIPADFNPANADRFGTHKIKSENINSRGSLKGPGQFTASIKANALNPALPVTNRTVVVHAEED